MTISEAARTHSIPRSRIYRAVRDATLKAAKVDGKWDIDPTDMEAAMRGRRTVLREGRVFTITLSAELLCERGRVFRCQTNAGADSFERLINQQTPAWSTEFLSYYKKPEYDENPPEHTP